MQDQYIKTLLGLRLGETSFLESKLKIIVKWSMSLTGLSYRASQSKEKSDIYRLPESETSVFGLM